MNKRDYIQSRIEKILKENIDEKADAILQRLNYKKEAPFNPEGSPFDYVQEGDGETCEQCGSEIKEGEACEQCGAKGEVMELGGMDDGHPRFGNKNLSKISKDELDAILHGDDEEEEFDFEDNDDDEWEDLDYETNWDELEENELEEKLYGGQNKLDKNKNGRLDSEDFKMLRRKKHIEEYTMGDDEIESVKAYGDDSTDSPNITPKNLSRARVKNVGDKYQRKVSKEFDDYESEQQEGALYEIEIERTNGKESALFTESEVIDMIEKIIREQAKKFKAGKQPRGYTEYERVHKADKKEEDDYMKLLAKKMKDYLKDSTKGEFKENPEKYPQTNYDIDKDAKVKKYTPSQAVDDYQDAFSYPGMTNLVYDEIKPNDKNIEKYLKGDSTTGNAQVDKDGKALGNVVPSEVGEKFYKNYKENLYGQEQQDASYKRQPQPVDQAGEDTERGSLKSKRGKKTSQSVLNKLEEGVNDKETQKLTEEFDRMKSLMGYTDKTQ